MDPVPPRLRSWTYVGPSKFVASQSSLLFTRVPLDQGMELCASNVLTVINLALRFRQGGVLGLGRNQRGNLGVGKLDAGDWPLVVRLLSRLR